MNIFPFKHNSYIINTVRDEERDKYCVLKT